jgi:CheY-like chemotaxis protein
MGQNYALAAAALTELLGQRVDKTALIAADGRPAPLVAALDYPDRRVRFAALEAILQIAPDSPFPGSSHVPETLGYFARGTGQRRAVVAMPTIQRAATVAGLLQTAGFDAAVTNRGSDAVKLAQLSPDVEFVLVDMNIQLPGIRDVLYALRIDPATGHLPVGLLAGEGRLAAAQRLADEHDRVLAFARPHSEEKVVAMSERLVALAGHNSVSPDARAAQSKQAIVWLGQLLADGPKFYDLRRQTDVIEAAALRPQAASESIAALAVLGTPAGQRALADLASLQTTSIATRREAAQAFDRNAQQHGLLLTSDEILRQYDRYNASATADAESQQVLGTVLDAIESQRSRQQTLPHAP